MKKRILICLPFSATLLFGLFVAANLQSKKDVKVEGYSTSSLPTTIDLNDTSEANIRSYYSSLNSLATSQRQGTNLLKNLKTILKNGQKYYSYDSGNAIWQIYEIADRDWDKSPASSTTYGTYNSGTNKITGYTYGTSSSSSKNNPYIHALYINRNVNNQTTAWDDHQQTQWGINREHVWPKAEGFETSGAGGARGDPMHLMAGNGYANNIHSNYFYGFVNTSSSYTNCGSKYSNTSGNLLGKSKTLGGSTNVFEPQDCDKGDIARAIFYMVARYNYLSGSDSDGIDSNNPNLTLTQTLSDWASSGYSSTTSTTGKMGIMTDLLAWHHADPVDEYEIHRNNLLYTNFTNNRNPFIDFPEWVDFIWGTATYNGTTYQSYSSTPTGYATPNSDTINGYNSGSTDPVAVTGVTLNKASTSIEATSTEELVATISPSNATNQGLTWTSSNTSVATVSAYGVVTGVNEGNATITVTTSDGGFTATCSVTVTAKSSGGGGESGTASVTIADYATANSWVNGTKYTSIPLDSVATASVQNGNTNTGKFYTAGNEWRFYQTESAAIEISLASGYELDSVTFNYNISNSGILLNSGDATVASGSPQTVSGSSVIFHVGNSGSATNGQVKFTSISVTYHETTEPSKTLTSITLDTSEAKTTFEVGEEFTYEDLIVTAHYSDLSEEQVVPDSVSSPDMSTAGTKTITVTYETESETYQITVNEATPTSITATPNKTFVVGETISKSDITVTTNLGIEVTDFTLSNAGYRFTYGDAASGGALTNKQFTVAYSGLNTTFNAQVQRVAHEEISSAEDNLTRDLIGVTGTQYSDWSGKTDESDAVYAGNTAGKATVDKVTVESIQLRTSNNNSGIVSTTSGGTLSSISVTFHSSTTSGRTLNIYGKNTAYSSPTDLYSNSSETQGTKLGTIVYGTSTSLTIEGSYTYIGIRSNSGAIYLTGITISYGAEDTAENLANYIMYTDTANQCTTKTSVAKGYFEGLSSTERETFMTSSDYVISTARERFQAWLRNRGLSISEENNDYVVSKATVNNPLLNKNITISTVITIITAVITSGLTIGGYFYFSRRKKED